MNPDLNPVQTAIRDHVAATYPAWRRTHEPIATRAGARYRGLDVALLFRPVLRDVGLHVYDDGNYFVGVFVTDTGKRITRERLLAQIGPAIAEHADTALVATAGTDAFLSALADLMPDYVGPVAFTRAPRGQSTVSNEHAAYVRDFLREVVDEPRRASEVYDVYTEWADADGIDYLGKATFYRVAEETALFTRRRRRDGAHLDRVMRALRPISQETAETLRACGVEDPTRYAEDSIADLLALAPTLSPEPLDPRALNLPFQVAYAIAGAEPERVVADFVLMARDHLERHPEDRVVVGAVALALQEGDPDGLVDHIRARCAAALRADLAIS